MAGDDITGAPGPRRSCPSLTCHDTSPMIDEFSQVDVTRSSRLAKGGRQRSWWAATMLVVNVLVLSVRATAQDPGGVDARQRERVAESQRLEGQAVLALADAAMGSGKGAIPADFRVRWRNAFLKAQQGTFVPFTLAFDAAGQLPGSALVYVRAVPRSSTPRGAIDRPDRARQANDRRAAERKAAEAEVEYPVDAIFPVDLRPDGSRVARVSRGFSIAPGDYDIYVVVRERPIATAPGTAPRAAVLTLPLTVPDFRNAGLTTSSVILAERLTVLSAPITADQLVERPYVIGQNEITPAVDDRFRSNDELVVVLLVYNPMVTPDRHFDIQVEYHFFQHIGGGRKPEVTAAGSQPPARDGERYFNHTDPQRFNPAIMGAKFDPGAGDPLLAGQGIPLGGFDRGDYRLAIKVTDLLSGKFVTRDVTFSVGS